MKFYVWSNKQKKYIENGKGFENYINQQRGEKYYSKIKELFKLFGEDHTFALDGVLNIDEYKNQGTRVLFLLKEAYDNSKHTESGLYIWDELAWAYDNIETIGNKNTWKRILDWTNLILNNSKKDINKKELIEKIALVNIKKFNGKPKSDDDDLKTVVNNNKKCIIEQIEYFNPTIIICGGTGWLLDLALDGELRKHRNPDWWYKFKFNKETETTVIDFWHPAYIKGDDALLNKLKYVLESSKNTLNHDVNDENDVGKE